VCLYLGPASSTVNRVAVPRENHVTADNLVTAATGKEKQAVRPGRAVLEQLSGSSSDSATSSEDIEQYDREPGVRQPSRSCSEDLDLNLEAYNEEPVPRERRQQGGKDADVDQKTRTKGPQRGFPDHVRNSPGLSEDVWKEAMEAMPLASSEPYVQDQEVAVDDNGGDDPYGRKGRRKAKPVKSGDRVTELKWSPDLPVNESLSRDTLDDISCDSYVPTQPVTGWDVDSLEGDLDDYAEEGTAKVLDMLAPDSDAVQGRVFGRRQERFEKEEQKQKKKKKTLSASFETNIDDIEFDTEPPGKGKRSVSIKLVNLFKMLIIGLLCIDSRCIGFSFQYII